MYLHYLKYVFIALYLNFQSIFCLKLTFFFPLMLLVTLDYKGLLLLWEKDEDHDFILGGQGLAVEFCIFRLFFFFFIFLFFFFSSTTVLQYIFIQFQVQYITIRYISIYYIN